MQNQPATLDMLRETVSRLQVASGALAALTAALDARARGRTLQPELALYIGKVVVALGVGDALASAEPADLIPLAAEMRVVAQTTGQLFPGAPAAGWTHDEAELLQAAGDASVPIARRIADLQLDGLAGRLGEPGAAFLDIGVGVAALSIEMARQWPKLRVLGIDRWPPALELARENVRQASLGDRIELREQNAKALSQDSAFDLAWVPGAFVGREDLPALLGAVRRALRSGGWVLIAIYCPLPDPLADAILRLRAAMFGGFVAPSEEVETLMRECELEDVRTLPRRPLSAMALLAGRRPR